MNNDLISREALKKELSKRLWFVSSPETDAQAIKDIIDNAPVVEPEKVLFANVTFDEDKLKDLVQTEVIEKIKSGELVIKEERPKGEWKQISPAKIYECKLCHKTVMTSDIEEYHYCHGCGAKMKGGAE